MTEYQQLHSAAPVAYTYDKPALLFGSDAHRRERAEPALAASGVRLVNSLSLEDAPARLEEQGSLGLAWLELGEEEAAGRWSIALATSLMRASPIGRTRCWRRQGPVV